MPWRESAKGNTIVIFPEDGRSRELAMRPFQRGAFLLAIRSELPILPLAIDGTYDIFRVGAKRITPGVVTIRAGTPDRDGRVGRAGEGLAARAIAGQIEAMLAGPSQP